MKKLQELPLQTVIAGWTKVGVPQPITAGQAADYLMFMFAIGDDLERHGGDVSQIMLSRIVELAKFYGGYVERDLSDVQDGTLIQAMLSNNQEEVMFTKMAYLTAQLLKD